MASIICPKCGFQQEAASECRRCGIVYAKYNSAGYARLGASSTALPVARGPGIFRRLYRVFRWVSLAFTAVILMLILSPSTPPEIMVTPQAIRQAEAKVKSFQKKAKAGRPRTLELSESELNGWLSSNLALRSEQERTSFGPHEKAQAAASAIVNTGRLSATPAPGVEQVESKVRDVKMELKEDLVRAYVIFDFHGKNLSLELEGRISVQDGYLRLEPTAGKLGSLPLPRGTLESATRRLLESPENREKFRVPDRIRDMHVDGGNLIITTR